MKRKGYLYDKIYDIDNLNLAYNKAKRGKSKQYGVIKFNRNKEFLLNELHHILVNNQFKTSKYKVFKLIENNKQREIFKLPFYPDRIVHHAIMNVLEDVFVKSFTVDTYSCLKNRGIHKCLFNLNKALKTKVKYSLKLDIKKFYPSIDNNILKQLLRKKFKDQNLLNLLDEIIDSSVGTPIGNYLSQFFANFYLNYFDHYVKEELKIKHYFRYCDDVVILADNKEDLHYYLNNIKEYLNANLKLKLSNYQIFPIQSRGIDFVGYKSYHNYILLRKSIKKKFIKMIKYNKNNKSIVSYNGWLKWCNSVNLKNKYL